MIVYPLSLTFSLNLLYGVLPPQAAYVLRGKREISLKIDPIIDIYIPTVNHLSLPKMVRINHLSRWKRRVKKSF